MGGSREDGALVKVGRELRQHRPEYNSFLFKIVLYAFQDIILMFKKICIFTLMVLSLLPFFQGRTYSVHIKMFLLIWKM